MAATLKPNHEAQMREERMQIAAGLGKAGAVLLCDERVAEFDSLDEAFGAMRSAGDATAALLARVFGERA